MKEELYHGGQRRERRPPFIPEVRLLGRIPCSRCWLLLCVIAAASGCARARANSVPAGPPLEVPAPPPRIVMPLQVEAEVPEPELEVPEEPPRQPPRPRAPVPTDAPARPADVPKVADEVPRPPSPAPPTTLQTTPAAAQGEVERAIRATMTRAGGDLNRIDYRALNADARTQYDTAKRFIEQADEAIRTKNLLFAKNLADKAAVLATQLLAR